MQLHADHRDLSPEKLKQCLEFARDWNTNSRRCHAAQAMLQAIILEHPPQVWQACCPLVDHMSPTSSMSDTGSHARFGDGRGHAYLL